MSRHGQALLVAMVTALGLAACTGSEMGPAATVAPAQESRAAVKFWDANATANWTDLATSLTARRRVDAIRLYAYLSLAQLRAAEDAAAIRPSSPTSSAIGAASASVLSAFFPADVAEIEAALAAQLAAEPWPGAKHEDASVGTPLGRAAAARVLAFSTSDLVGLTDPGTPPTTPGHWLWSGGPIARGFLGARPFFLASGDEFGPGPPPAFGSPEYLAALAEVRAISDTRTPEQLAIAQAWNAGQGPNSNARVQNLAVELLRAHRRSDVESARILFRMDAAIFDALIGCFDAKYTYWFIRPPQADPMITLPIGLPPHPSYPSAHSCVSGAASGVLMAAFPDERDRFESIAQEASLSRLYAGIHYRFDMVAGLALGRNVADKAMSADLDAVAVR
jgi:membrane-associated phospholipid phosphatase